MEAQPSNIRELLLTQFPVGEDDVCPGGGQALIIEPHGRKQGEAQPGAATRSLPQPFQQIVSLSRPLDLRQIKMSL